MGDPSLGEGEEVVDSAELMELEVIESVLEDVDSESVEPDVAVIDPDDDAADAEEEAASNGSVHLMKTTLQVALATHRLVVASMEPQQVFSHFLTCRQHCQIYWVRNTLLRE